jgi:hypothetical protein
MKNRSDLIKAYGPVAATQSVLPGDLNGTDGYLLCAILDLDARLAAFETAALAAAPALPKALPAAQAVPGATPAVLWPPPAPAAAPVVMPAPVVQAAPAPVAAAVAAPVVGP